MLYGSIEAGGTKFVCAVGNEALEIIDRVSFPTTTPEETMKLVRAFFKKHQHQLASIGIGSFGPIDINHDSDTYGFITSTPKLPWRDFNFVGTLKKDFDIPITWTTDVNAAAYGEYVKRNTEAHSSIVYYTVGTGIGGGAIQKGNFIEGFSHPEMGHMMVIPHSKDKFEGTCPFHGKCLEGMASGPAIEKRNGRKGQDIPEDNMFWDMEAFYIAQCAYNTTLILAPDVIIFGGGVMKQEHMLKRVRLAFAELLKDYVKTPELSKYIVSPILGDDAATIGNLALAKKETSRI